MWIYDNEMVNLLKNRHTSHFILFPSLENLRESLAVAQRLRDAPRRLKVAGAPGVCAHVQCAPELDTTCAVLDDQCARSRRRSPFSCAVAVVVNLAVVRLCCCRRQFDPPGWSSLSWFDPRAGNARKWVRVGACAALVSLVCSRLNATIYNYRCCAFRPLRTF